MLPILDVRVSVTFYLICVHIIFSSVSVAEWPPFGKKAAHSVDHMVSLYFLTICNISYFPFWF